MPLKDVIAFAFTSLQTKEANLSEYWLKLKMMQNHLRCCHSFSFFTIWLIEFCIRKFLVPISHHYFTLSMPMWIHFESVRWAHLKTTAVWLFLTVLHREKLWWAPALICSWHWLSLISNNPLLDGLWPMLTAEHRLISWSIERKLVVKHLMVPTS